MSVEALAIGAPGTDLHYALLYDEPRLRDAVVTLFALHAEIDAVPRTCSDAGIARSKLAWWSEEAARWEAGAPRHPLTRRLAMAGAGLPLPRATLASVVAAVAAGFAAEPPRALADLELEHAQATGALTVGWAALAGATDPDTQARVRALGTVLGAWNALRDARPDLAAGRVRISREDLLASGATLADLSLRPGDAPACALARLQIERALAGLDAFAHGLDAARRRRLRGPLAYAAIVRATLLEVAADGHATFARRVALTPLRKLWIAWRTRSVIRDP